MPAPSEVRALGFPYRPIEVVGIVPRPPLPPPPPPPAMQPAAIPGAAPQTEPAAAGDQQAAAGVLSTRALPAAAQGLAVQPQSNSPGLPEQLKGVEMPQEVLLLQGAVEDSLTAQAHVPVAQQQQQQQQIADALPSQGAGLAANGAASTAKHHLAAASVSVGADPDAMAGPAAARLAKAYALAQPEQLPSALMWTMQHWLLVVQVTVMAGAVAMLAAYSRQRRLGSPRTLPLFSLPCTRLIRKP